MESPTSNTGLPVFGQPEDENIEITPGVSNEEPHEHRSWLKSAASANIRAKVTAEEGVQSLMSWLKLEVANIAEKSVTAETDQEETS